MLKQRRDEQHLGSGALRHRPTFTTDTIVVPPGETRSMGLGVYNQQDATPQFHYTCTPAADDDMLGAQLDRLSIPGSVKYLLLYLFHNYSAKECKIEVVREQGPP